jgi:xylulose-5-phosphate/fructose-6-phosphate phosphoketolase
MNSNDVLFDAKSIRAKHSDELSRIERYRRLANYLAVAQIYLRDNVLLKKPLGFDDVKERLLGHWGTCPGINMVYAHLNGLICRHNVNMFLVTGPGHGAPANLANLYLEGSLKEFYPELSLDKDGLTDFIKRFSTPNGFPSHLYPGTPGAIHEGGELGYALATSFGAVMDNPDLVVACIVGDGEAETGPTAAAWHSYKFIDPKESGAVLPVLHLNGYKISSPTIFGTMSDNELVDLFGGYGYNPRIVQDSDLDADLYGAMEWAYSEIRRIQDASRNGKRIIAPRWPVIIFKSPKGMSGIKEMDGEPVEGTHRSHQVPNKDAKTNKTSLKLLEDWLRSYNPDELFDKDGAPKPEILEICPKGILRMGLNPHTFGHNMWKPLNLPDIYHYEFKLNSNRGTVFASPMEELGKYLAGVVKNNLQTFRIFSPDELESNKLHGVFKETARNFQWPLKEYDSYIGAEGGRVIEILSEHTCQAFLQGYILTGRHGIFPSYEAFLGVITTMMDQFGKFIKFSRQFPWRGPVASLNYLETSTLWRQEHNGFSHQNPSFINSVLDQQADNARIYFPPDANCLISTVDHCLRSRGYVNLVVANKNPQPQWLSMNEAIEHCRAGASIWRWASTDDGLDPDITIAGIGDVPTIEVLACARILKEDIPELRLRVVNINDLMVLEEHSSHPHGLAESWFNALFTPDKPVIFNFHGYPSAVKQLLFGRPNIHRFIVNGYLEEGSTTTPFDMLIRNQISRYHLATQALKYVSRSNLKVAAKANELANAYHHKLEEIQTYIMKYADDPDEIINWKW